MPDNQAPADTEVMPETEPARTPSASLFNDAMAKQTGAPATETEQSTSDVVLTESVKTSDDKADSEKPDTSFIPPELLTETSKPEEELPEKFSDVRNRHWAQARKHSADLEKQLSEARAELETARKAPPADEKTTAELKAEREQRTVLEAKLERAAFMESPKFMAKLTEEADALTAAKAELQGTEVNPELVEHAARLTGEKRRAVLKEAGADSETIAAVVAHLAEFDKIGRQKAAMLADHKGESERWKAEERQRAEQSEAQQRAEDEKVFAGTADEVATSTGFKRIPGQDKWNARLDAVDARAAEIDHGNISRKDAAIASRKAALTELVLEINASLRNALKAATAQVQKLTGAQPSLGEARTGAQTSAADMKPGQIFEQALANRAAGQ